MMYGGFPSFGLRLKYGHVPTFWLLLFGRWSEMNHEASEFPAESEACAFVGLCSQGAAAQH